MVKGEGSRIMTRLIDKVVVYELLVYEAMGSILLIAIKKIKKKSDVWGKGTFQHEYVHYLVQSEFPRYV